MNCKDSEKPGAEPGRPPPLIPPALHPQIRAESPTPSGALFRRGEKTTHGRSSKKPTVGRQCDLPWVGKTTYSRFFSRALGDAPRDRLWNGFAGGGGRGPFGAYLRGRVSPFIREDDRGNFEGGADGRRGDNTRHGHGGTRGSLRGRAS